MEKFLENLDEAQKIIMAMDHLVYVTFPLIKDKKMLIRIAMETKKAIALCINSILQNDYLYKRIKLYSNQQENFLTFREKCAPRYEISKEDINKITSLFELVKKHKKSPLEFVRNEKVIIMSEDFYPEILTLEKTKEFVVLAKNLLLKIAKNLKKY